MSYFKILLYIRILKPVCEKFYGRLFFKGAHGQTLDDRFSHKECEDGNREDDQGGCGANSGPVDLSIRDEIIDGDRNGFGLRARKDE